MARELNIKRRLFIKEYLVDANATQAAIRAGYSPGSARQQASELLTNPHIKSMIEQGLRKKEVKIEARVDETGDLKARWLDEIKALAFSDLTGMMTTNEHGRLTMSLEEIKKRNLGRLIKKIKFLPGGKAEFDLHPKLPAIELLGKHFGWVKDQIEHSGEINSATLSENEFKKLFSDPKTSALAVELAELTSTIPKQKENT